MEIHPLFYNNAFLKKNILFIRQAHDSINQKRKYTKDPYWTHTERVALNVAEHFPQNTEYYLDIIVGAAAHDVKEDVQPLNPLYTDDYLLQNFGQTSFDLMVELTNVYTKEAYPKLNTDIRSNLENTRISSVSSIAKTIKCFDIMDNTAQIPDDLWREYYVLKKIKQLPFLIGADQEVLDKTTKQLFDIVDKYNYDIDK